MPPPGVEAAKRDRLSELPDDFLHRILRPLDARSVVGELSRLSRRWRHLWATSPYVTLRSGYHGSEKFGNLLLLLRDGGAPLREFSLHSWSWEHFSYERRWLRHALTRGLRVLEINLGCRNCIFQPPDCVFSCATLEEFSLTANAASNEIIAPRSVSLPRLKKLHLEFVRFQDPSVVEKLFNSGCPVLEDPRLCRSSLGSFKVSSDTLKILCITDCVYEEIHVSAPNACSLRLTVSSKVQLDQMPFLVSAWVYLCDGGVQHLAQGGYDLAASLCNAQHLELFRFSLFQDMMGDSALEGLAFCKLKRLYLGEWRVTDFYGPLPYFLRRAPDLASLTLDQGKLYERHDGKVPSGLKSTGDKPRAELKLVSALTKDLETLLIRLSKGDEIGEFRKMRGLLKEKTKPKETEIVWF